MTDVYPFEWRRLVVAGAEDKAENAARGLSERGVRAVFTNGFLELVLTVAADKPPDLDKAAAEALDPIAPDWRMWTYRPGE